MLKKNLKSETEIWAAMCARFPWVVEERGEEGEGLIHLDFAALRRGVELAADRSDAETARDILQFVEELLSDRLSLHPDVENAIDVSFVEDLYLSEPHQRDFAEPLLGEATRQRWDEVRSYDSTG